MEHLPLTKCCPGQSSIPFDLESISCWLVTLYYHEGLLFIILVTCQPSFWFVLSLVSGIRTRTTFLPPIFQAAIQKYLRLPP